MPYMTDSAECFVRMLGDGKKAVATSFVISLAGEATVSSHFRQRARVYGVASRWRNSAKSSCMRVIGTPNHDPSGRPVLMRWILISTLSQEAIRKADSEAVPVVSGAPG